MGSADLLLSLLSDPKMLLEDISKGNSKRGLNILRHVVLYASIRTNGTKKTTSYIIKSWPQLLVKIIRTQLK